MKPTVTLSLEDFDQMRAFEQKAKAFEQLADELRPYIMYPEITPMTFVRDTLNQRKYIYLKHEQLEEIILRFFA